MTRPTTLRKRRALVTFHETAERQLAALTDHDLARPAAVLDAIAADPEVGRPLVGSPLRECEQGGVGAVIVVAYVEMQHRESSGWVFGILKAG